MADITYTVVLSESGLKAFTMPQGYWPDVEIHCWGAGGGNGRGGARGGAGGYAKSTVNIYQGDEVILQIGQPGTNGGYPTGGKGGLDTTYSLFRGGNSSNAYDEDADTGAGGGGGGASWVAVNGTYVCVGAGGGGAGGYGDDGSGGYPGLPGGVTTNGLNTDTRGGNAPAGWATGGGGGAGYPYGGKAGTSYGDDSGNPPAGSGGQNYGNVTVAGSGVTPGGNNVSYYPGQRRGEQGYAGYIAIVLRKKLNVNIKNADGSGNWVNVESLYYKLPTQTAMILSASPSQSTTLATVGPNQWTVPAGVTSVSVTVKGGGGGGGGGHFPCGNSSHHGGAGGTGYVNLGTLTVTPGQIINYTIGVGGAGGAKGSPGATGSTGGTTTFGSISALGGSGGTGGSGSGAGQDGSGGTSGTDGAGGGGRPGGAGGLGDPNETDGSKGSDGLIQLSWTPDPIYVPTVTGGWKQIQQAFVKVSGDWKPILTNKTISLYDTPGKRISANIIISSDTNDYDLYSNLPVTYFEGLMDIDVWVLPGVVITGNNTSTAFTISGFSPADNVRLHNYGNIQGRGGNGGSGSYTYTTTVSSGSKSSTGTGIGYNSFNSKSYTTTATASATAGQPGGTGLLLQSQITLINNGTIAGGGGGGGGGTSSGRGGGGAGYGSGYNNGTLTTGGAGGTGAGSGGSRGQAGSSGSAVGGAAGYAVRGNLLIIPATSTIGTLIGPVAG